MLQRDDKRNIYFKIKNIYPNKDKLFLINREYLFMSYALSGISGRFIIKYIRKKTESD